MIPFEFSYTRAETVEEALAAWRSAREAGESVAYHGGGTELVTLARDNKRRFDRLIDYKGIPEAQQLGPDGSSGSGEYHFGAALRLNTLVDDPQTGLVGLCARGVADRTVRNSITLGGNICGMLAYREAVLPFLLLDGRVTFASPGETSVPGVPRNSASGGTAEPTGPVQSAPIREIFDRKLTLPEGGVALSFSLDAEVLAGLGPVASRRLGRYGALSASGFGPRGGWFYQRHTRDPHVDYPLATVAAAVLDGTIRIAVSGAWGYPLRATGTEELLNEAELNAISAMDPPARRELIGTAVDAQQLSWKQDMRGSRDYRRELTILAIEDGLAALAGKQEGTTA
jgi:xanthine dehydrogenase FAD-binding subunit